MPTIYTPQPKPKNGVKFIVIRTPRKGYRRKDVLIALRQTKEKLGKWPNHLEWTQLGRQPSSTYVYKLFGSWKSAIRQAKELPPKFVYRLERKTIIR